jgi:L-2,4-diaminobutyric acid acetyltransferase
MTQTKQKDTSSLPSIRLRIADQSDGARIWQTVQAIGSLELNSAYFYLLFATDFNETCLIAESGSDMVGVVIGYHPPRQPDVAFVWQVGVLPRMRGQGLGLRMLKTWSSLPANHQKTWICATVAQGNPESQALFRCFARDSQVDCHEQDHFTAAMFPGEHAPEQLFRIGPLAPRNGREKVPESIRSDLELTVLPALPQTTDHRRNNANI